VDDLFFGRCIAGTVGCLWGVFVCSIRQLTLCIAFFSDKCHFNCTLQYPEESVLMQQRIINRVEGDAHYHKYLQSFEPTHDNTSAAAIILAARQIARTVQAKAIVTFTVGGTTALRASKKRPDVPILAISPLQTTSRQLALSWGVYSEFTPTESLDTDDFRGMLAHACEVALRKGLVKDANDLLVVTAGFPFGTPGAANIIRVIPAAGPTHWDASL
jgi:pyruvate kinase